MTHLPKPRALLGTLAFFVPLMLPTIPAASQDKAATPEKVPVADDVPSAQELSVWIMTYYQRPEPDKFGQRVRQLSARGMLKGNRPEFFTMFLGRVMHAHPERIAGWMEAWKDLPADELEILRNGIWNSQTDAGKQWLRDHKYAELADKPAPPLIAGGPMVLEPYHLDLMWEWFFATGAKEPVLLIVDKFPLNPQDPGDDELPPVPNRQGVDRPTFLRATIGRTAVWSAASLAARHDKLLEHLRAIRTDPRLPPRGKLWLDRVIQIAERDREKNAKT
jgi:hypothetical protein